ncbi:MAG TPA: lactonase family protein [Chthoniobacteraceae bacterium]|nr:lactonase family protein [Chthoniobacteraceae bacterium]
MKLRNTILLCLFLCMLHVSAADIQFYVGTYTRPNGSKGIYHFRLDGNTGAISGGELAAESKSPSFLALHPTKKFLYAVNEVDGSGGVSAFAIEAGGKLRPLNQQPSRGAGACHLSVDAAGKTVFVANYGAGNIAALPIKPDGSLAPATGFVQHHGSSADPQRQKEPHAHSIYPGSDGTLVYACDLGTDKIYIYRFNSATGELTPHEPASASVPAGSGPRHLAFLPGFAYVINEMGNTVSVFQHDAAAGKLALIQTIGTLPDDFTGESTTAEIFAHPNGKFVYGSNRGHDSIAVFRVDASSGKLGLVEHESTQGKSPRNFAISPDGRWLIAANQQTNNLVVFKVDESGGTLTPANQSVPLGAPVCVTFVP